MDFKIFMSTLAQRINTFAGEYVAQDQVGFIPSKDICDNTVKNLYLISHCLRSQSLSLALSIDIENAFDTLEPSFLMAVLDNMGSGPFFMKIVSALYAAPHASLGVNLHQASPIKL